MFPQRTWGLAPTKDGFPSDFRELKRGCAFRLHGSCFGGEWTEAVCGEPGPPSFQAGAALKNTESSTAVRQVHDGDVQSEPALFAVERSVRTEERISAHSGIAGSRRMTHGSSKSYPSGIGEAQIGNRRDIRSPEAEASGRDEKAGAFIKNSRRWLAPIKNVFFFRSPRKFSFPRRLPRKANL